MPPVPYILVVEDDEGTRSTICAALQAAGFSVRGAGNGREALEHLQSKSATPGLVVLDLAMPIMDGYEFLTKLREQSALGVVPIIVVTSSPYDSRLAGSVGYMRKPVRLDQLVSAARTWCTGSSSAAQ